MVLVDVRTVIESAHVVATNARIVTIAVYNMIDEVERFAET